MTSSPVFDLPDYKALLAAVIEHPEADLPRLVLADWLDEHDQAEYAEFIRLQCEIAATTMPEQHAKCMVNGDGKSACPTCGPYYRILDRERLLLKEFAHVWFDGCVGGGNDLEAEFAQWWRFVKRGFVVEWHGAMVRWCGEECACGLSGAAMAVCHLPRHDRNCTTCHGTGRTESVGPTLVRSQPVEIVRLTGCDPHVVGDPDGVGAHGIWAIDDGTPRYAGDGRIPADLWMRLPGGTVAQPGWKSYGTEADCRTALSDAAIRWAKETPPASDPVADIPRRT